MAQFAITGDDTLNIDGFPNLTNDMADGDTALLELPNDLVNIAVGKNKNAIYAKDENGNQFNLTLRVLKGSSSDAALLDKLKTQNANFASTVLMTGSFVKKLGDGYGNIKSFSANMAGGILKKFPGTKTNVNGDIDQSVTEYVISGIIQNFSIG